ncbi:MAG TPA: hypothetical protein VGW76_14595 [Pyrinomonadaceae bacterium]|nr:hypothetical protein [Pyrinomonadaceae bacterium]
MGTTVTDEELKNDPQLQEGLRKGKITTKDGAVITLKPIDQIRARFRPLPGLLNRPISIDRTQLESRFDEVIRTESVDRAIEGYQTLLNNSLVTINGKPTLRLESLGEEALKKKLYDAAIRFFQLNVETYPELGRAYFKLADAYESRFKLGAKTEDRENAIRNYELVLTSKITNPIVRDRALERLKSLRGQ